MKDSPGISSTKFSLPKGGGAIQGIGETFQPNPFSGTGNLSIPIPSSPCRGFEPQLSLNYSSGSGNSVWGLGFDLPIPSISRKLGKGTPKYHQEDTFIISNAEDLVPKLKKDTEGNWLTDKEEIKEGAINYSVTRYRPRTEGVFACIERWVDVANGDTHWRVTAADNTMSKYGQTPDSRIADSEDTHRIFQWLLDESKDAKGNIIRYEYRAENEENVTADIHEHNRKHTANRYLDRIKYGEYVNAEESQWHFELVFDYGERNLNDDNELTTTTDKTWPQRSDPFSAYQAGFEIRTHRLCRAVLLFHRFPDQFGGEAFLVQATRFTYEERGSLSRILEVQQTAYSYQAAGAYKKKSLPPVDFTYSAFDLVLSGEFQPLNIENHHQVPGYLGSQAFQMIDLQGDGLPGILYNSPDNPLYWSPCGDGRFMPPKARTTFPLERANPTAAYTLTDHDGNGKLDLVVADSGRAGYYPSHADGRWGTFRSFESYPGEQRLPTTLIADFTGNGLGDILSFQNKTVKIYPSLGQKGFGPPFYQQPQPHLPVTTILSGHEVLRIGDPLGDGGSHLIHIRSGSVDCFPHLGYGRFGEKVSLKNAPRFDEGLDANRLFLADIDGSGTTDIIYARGNHLEIYYNQGGNSFNDAVTLPLPQRYDDLEHLQFADVLGNGTSCLVLTQRTADLSLRHEYYDFCANGKPHLLIASTNNLGVSTRLYYQPSTKFFLDDQKAGRSWLTRLHFPVQLLERTETIDHISGTKFVSRYAFHDGYFDPVEREFRGFGLVERWDTEIYDEFNREGLHGKLAFNKSAQDLHVPPVYVKTWYHTGHYFENRSLSRAYATDYYTGDPDAHELPDSVIENLEFDPHADTKREAARALRGQVLREEVYALDSDEHPGLSEHPYSVSENNFRVRIVQPKANQRHAVCMVIPAESISYHYERNPADPRIAHSFLLESDEYGHPVKNADVFYPRRSGQDVKPEQTTLKATVSTSLFIHNTEDFYLLGVPYEQKAFELGGLDLEGNTYFDFEQIVSQVALALENKIPFDQTMSGESEARLLSCSRYYYWNEAQNTPLDLGSTTALALFHHSETAAFSPNQLTAVLEEKLDAIDLATEGGYKMIDNYWWIPGSVQYYGGAENYYLPSMIKDVFEGSTIIGYDTYVLLPKQLTDALGNITQVVLDYQTLAPWKIIDPNGNISEVLFDPLGMVIATTVYGTENGEQKGDDPIDQYQIQEASSFEDVLANPANYLQNATTYFFYDLYAWQDKAQPPRSISLVRETHCSDLNGEQTKIQIGITYSDGLGRSLQNKLRSDPGIAFEIDENGNLTENTNANERWLVSGRTVYNNKGNPVKQYETFYSVTPNYEAEEILTEYGVTSVLHYDPLSRVIRVDTPKGFFSKVEFSPWWQRSYDTNDTVKDAPYFIDHLNNDLSEDEQLALEKAQEHYNTPTEALLDNQGRVFLIIERLDATGNNLLQTYIELDIQGNELSSSDPRLYPEDKQNFRHTYAMNGLMLYSWSADAGERWSVSNVLSKTIHSWDQRGFHTMISYDELQRPVEMYVEGNDGAGLELAHVVQRIEYGEGEPDSPINNLCGRPVRHYDSAGLVDFKQYSFKGELLEVERHIRVAYKTEVNWQDINAVALEEEAYTSENIYDALGRVVYKTHADESIERPVYNAESQLQQLYLNLNDGAGEREIIKRLIYNARGQRTQIEYGNGVITTYEYETDTFRLIQLKTIDSNSRLLQDIHYTYDPVGNITRIRDASSEQIFNNKPAIEALNDYNYDALYRLAAATGRKHPELTGAEYKDPTAFKQSRFLGLDEGGVLESYTEDYQYDRGGNLTQVEHGGGTGTWTRELQIATSSNRGVLKSLAATPEQVDDFYDEHGNLLRSEHLQALHWNHYNHLAAVELSEEQNNGREYYIYDAGGQRVRKVTETAAGEIKMGKKYLGPLEIKYDEAGNIQEQTLNIRNDAHATITLRQPTGEGAQLRYQMSNHLGSVALELDENAALLSYEEYLPYGGTAFIAGEAEEAAARKEYRYSGKERDDASGLCYYGARYYAPWMGRWLNTDPAGTVDGLNVYGFVRGNPVVLMDSDGRQGKRATGIDNQQRGVNVGKHSPIVSMNPFVHLYNHREEQKRNTPSDKRAKKSAEELLFPSLFQHKAIDSRTIAEYGYEFATGGVTEMIQKSLDSKFNPQGQLRATVKPEVPAGPKRALIGLTGEALDTAAAATGLASEIDPGISPALGGFAAALKNYSRDASIVKSTTMGVSKGVTSFVESKAPWAGVVSVTGLARNIAEIPQNYTPHLQTLGIGRTENHYNRQHEKALGLYDLTQSLLNEMDESLAGMDRDFLNSRRGQYIRYTARETKEFLLRQRKKTAKRTQTPIQ